MRAATQLVVFLGILAAAHPGAATQGIPGAQAPGGRPPGFMAAPPVTQGQFAVALAARLGLGKALPEARAIARLEALGIVPDAGWARRGHATDLFVVQIQQSVHILLGRMASDLRIPVPSTLDLVIATPGQSGGQTFETPKPGDAQTVSQTANSRELLATGTSRSVSIESPHPYPQGDHQRPVVWSYRLRVPGAAQLAVHFSKIDLAEADMVRVLDRRGQERLRIVGGTAREDVWSLPVDGDSAVVLIHGGVNPPGWGFRLDRYVFRGR